MAVIWDKLARRTFQVLKAGGYKLTLYNDIGNRTFTPEGARFFYAVPDHIMVSIIDQGDRTELNCHLSGDRGIQELLPILKNLRLNSTHFNVSFNVRKYGRTLAPKDFFSIVQVKRKQMENVDIDKDGLFENLGKFYGSKMVSRKKIGEARVKVVHNHPVDEEKHGSRSRDIHDIFIEYGGEVLRYPHKHLRGAYAMARHISEGGDRSDELGKYISSLSEEVGSLASVSSVMYRNRNYIEEGNYEKRFKIKERIEEIKSELNTLMNKTSYVSFSENWSPKPINENESEILDEDVFNFGYEIGLTLEETSDHFEGLRTSLKVVQDVQEQQMKNAKGLIKEAEHNLGKTLDRYAQSNLVADSKSNRKIHAIGDAGWYIVSRPLISEARDIFLPTKLAGPFGSANEARTTALWKKIGNKRGPFDTKVVLEFIDNKEKFAIRKFHRNSFALNESTKTLVSLRDDFLTIGSIAKSLSYEDFNTAMLKIEERYRKDIFETLKQNLAAFIMVELSDENSNHRRDNDRTRAMKAKSDKEEDPTESVDFNNIMVEFDDEDDHNDDDRTRAMKAKSDKEEDPTESVYHHMLAQKKTLN